MATKAKMFKPERLAPENMETPKQKKQEAKQGFAPFTPAADKSKKKK